MSFPYLDVPGFRIRTIIPREFVDELESFSPGWIAQSIAGWSSWMNSRLRKRLGNAPNIGNSLPLGQKPPVLVPAGTNPPLVVLTGRPTLGSLQMLLTITTGGDVGTAVFSWSSNKGLNTTTGVVTAPSVSLGTTGLSATFPVGTYGTDNVYAAEPPVPEIVLRWLTDLVSFDAMCRRYRNSQDPAIADFKARCEETKQEVKEAADGKDGLFDLPVNEDSDTAVTTGAPMGYSETSPYVWTDRQANAGGQQDASGFGRVR